MNSTDPEMIVMRSYLGNEINQPRLFKHLHRSSSLSLWDICNRDGKVQDVLIAFNRIWKVQAKLS